MFNTYSYSPEQKVNINAVSGTLSKTCDKSFFKSFRTDNIEFEQLMSDHPTVSVKEGRVYESIEVVILQSMLMGNERVLFELIKKSDYEQMKGGKRDAD